jgi:uncharacterized protein YggE
MKKGIIVAIGMALVLITVGVAGCGNYFGSEETGIASSIYSQQNVGIWVTGVGKTNVTPDMAVLSLGIEAQAMTVAEAQQQAAQAMDAVMGVLDSHSVDEKDIQTQQYSIQPVREWHDDQYALLGYRVTNTVKVKVRNIDDTGSIIDGVAAAGGDYTIVNSISFTVDEPENYYEQMREEAMADAKDRAEQLADLGGVKLGKPIYIAESSSYNPPIVYLDYKSAEGAVVPTTSISPGETELQLTVQVVYSIS